MKEERIFIDILKFDNGEFNFFVGGGTRENGQIQDCSSLNEVMNEIGYRLAMTFLDMRGEQHG